MDNHTTVQESGQSFYRVTRVLGFSTDKRTARHSTMSDPCRWRAHQDFIRPWPRLEPTDEWWPHWATLPSGKFFKRCFVYCKPNMSQQEFHWLVGLMYVLLTKGSKGSRRRGEDDAQFNHISVQNTLLTTRNPCDDKTLFWRSSQQNSRASYCETLNGDCTDINLDPQA